MGRTTVVWIIIAMIVRMMIVRMVIVWIWVIVWVRVVRLRVIRLRIVWIFRLSWVGSWAIGGVWCWLRCRPFCRNVDVRLVVRLVVPIVPHVLLAIALPRRWRRMIVIGPRRWRAVVVIEASADIPFFLVFGLLQSTSARQELASHDEQRKCGRLHC